MLNSLFDNVSFGSVSFVCPGLYLGKSLQCPIRESRKHGMKERRSWALTFKAGEPGVQSKIPTYVRFQV